MFINILNFIVCTRHGTLLTSLSISNLNDLLVFLSFYRYILLFIQIQRERNKEATRRAHKSVVVVLTMGALG